MTAQPAEAPSASVEDYLKAIYSVTRRGEGAATSELAARLGHTQGTVSAMLRRLDELGLADYVPYRGVSLTGDGERAALTVIRRHRLIESFLVSSLDIPWDEVHEYAEELEHAAPPKLIEAIARKLGDPEVDPHGDPIPARDLSVQERPTESLAALEPGQRATLVRVSDSDPEKLRYLSAEGIAIGDEIEMLRRHPFDGPCEIRIGSQRHTLGTPLAELMRVEVEATAESDDGS